MKIPVVVCAKNEEAMLGACLDSLAVACAFAEERLPVALAKIVVLDDTHDKSAQIADSRGFTVLRARGGKVEAQRVGAKIDAPVHVFCDADVVIAPDTLHAILAPLLASPSLRVVAPPKLPVPPRSLSRLARAIYAYNHAQGYARRRTWFSGKLFAIRGWHIPEPRELEARITAARDDRFLDLRRGLIADDVYLSRLIVAEHGAGAIAHSDGGMVWFRAPETLRGMYRYFRRMRRELERVDALFPETRAAHRRFGIRRTDWRRLRRAPVDEQLQHAHFRAAVLACRLLYRLDRFYHRQLGHFTTRPTPDWIAIAETKQPVFDPPA